MSIEDTLREVAPSEKQIIRTAENTLIRRAIWSLPKPVMWAGVVIVIVMAAVWGK